MTIKKPIRGSLAGINPETEHVVMQPWVDESRSFLETSNFLNICSPKRYGKSALGNILLERQGPGKQTLYRKAHFVDISLMAMNDGHSSPLEINFFALFYVLGPKFQSLKHFEGLKQLSPQEAAKKATGIVEAYQEKLHHYTGSRQFTFCADEMSGAFYDREFRAFFSEFYEQNKQNPDLRFIAITHYPIAAYDWSNAALPVMPEVWARSWDQASSIEYCEDVKQHAEEVKWAASYFGGCPHMLNKFYDRYEEPHKIITEYVHGQARSMLRQAYIAECAVSLSVLDKLIEGQVFKPATDLEQAALVHLLVAGLAKASSDGFVIQGMGIQQYLANPSHRKQFVEDVKSSRKPHAAIGCVSYVEERRKYNPSLIFLRPGQCLDGAPADLNCQ